MAPVYQIVADRIGRTNTACRIKLHHIKHNVDMGAISLADALAAKRLPLAAPEKVREQAVGKKAVSRKRALCRKKNVFPAPASKARKQVAAEKRACSSKDAVADKPLPVQACKSQEQASAERRAASPGDAPDEKPPSGLTSTLQQLSFEEELSRYRSPEGERILEAASTLMSMKMQVEDPNLNTRTRHDSFAAGSTFGRMTMPDPNLSSTKTVQDRSISSTEAFHNYYVEG